MMLAGVPVADDDDALAVAALRRGIPRDLVDVARGLCRTVSAAQR
jgi:hypothetical protein